jgi:long-chain acyl-CoA synthetase
MTVSHTVTHNAAIQAGGNRFARALDALAVPARGSIATLLPNVPEFVWTYRGAGWSGRRLTPMSWRWTADDARYVVHNCEAEVLVAHARFADVAQIAGAHLPRDRRIAVGGPIPGFVPYDAIVGGESDAPLTAPLAGDTMLYTSGTTGRPKGVLRGAPQDVDPPTRVGRAGIGMIRQFLPEGEDRVHLVASPLYHAGPVSYCEGASLLGADVVLVDGWDAEELLALIERYRVTSTFLVPIHFVRLLRLPPAVRARYDLSSLRLVIHGSAPVAPVVKRAMIDWFGPVLYEFYGGTEGGGCSISSTDWLRKPGSVGRPFAHLELHVLDDDGQPCAPGESGTVWFRQPEAFTYKDEPEQTAAVQRSGLMTLGDIGHVDGDGYLFLDDRRADVIVSGGVNLYPAQIEAALLAHPAVADCCVVGVPDDEWGEAVHAVIQVVPGMAAGDAAELVATLGAWCRDRLGGHQVPRSFEPRAVLPRTETGKLARRAIRDPYWEGRSRRI